MGFFEDLGNGAASLLSAVGDAIETVVEVVTETVETGVDVVEDVVDNVSTGVRDWVAANTNPILTGLVNFGLGMVEGVVDFALDLTRDVLHIVSDVGQLFADLFRLDFAGVLTDLLNIAIGVGELLSDALRFVFGGYFFGAVYDNFERDRRMNLLRTMLVDEFGEKRADDILRRLGFGGVKFGVRISGAYSVFRMDSAVYPLAADHPAVFDLFAMAGVLSFDSFNVFRERTRVVQVDAGGSDAWYLPVGRSTIQSFLDTGSPRLRVYAWKNYPASRAMRFARQKFRKLCLLIDFGSVEYLSRFQSTSAIDITATNEYLFPGLADDYTKARFLATRTPQDGDLLDDFSVQACGNFKFVDGIRGVAVGLRINRGTAACPADSTTDACITEVRRSEGDFFSPPTSGPTGDPTTPCGRGVFHRDTYPPYFSKFVLAHEIGHHFGLAHAGHAGVQNIMYSSEQAWLDWGVAKWYYQGEPDFQPEDFEHVWRFLIKKLPHVLGA